MPETAFGRICCIILLLVVGVIPVAASASDNHDSSSAAAAAAEQAQGQKQGQGQEQAQTATATGGNAVNGAQQNSQSFAIETPHQAPAVFAPSAYPSAPCRVSVSGGFSILTGGGAFGGSKMDHECDKRETARSFFEIGEYKAALQILCSTQAAEKAGVSACRGFEHGKKKHRKY